jgi:hypothetical protein
VIEHVAAAPSEQTYDAVPIPGAYASPLTGSGERTLNSIDASD